MLYYDSALDCISTPVSLRSIFQWPEPDTFTRCIIFSVILLSGLMEFTLRVFPGGNPSELSVKWGKRLIDLELMYKTWESVDFLMRYTVQNSPDFPRALPWYAEKQLIE